MVLIEIRFTQTACKHRIGRASVRYVMAGTGPTPAETAQGNPAWRYVGADERGRELEIVAVELDDGSGGQALLVIHVMPTRLRGGTHDG